MPYANVAWDDSLASCIVAGSSLTLANKPEYGIRLKQEKHKTHEKSAVIAALAKQSRTMLD